MQLPREQPLRLQPTPPLQLPPKQSPTIAHLLCCGALHLYVEVSSIATEPNRFSPQQIQQQMK
jgi:hypothetical protein